MSVWTDRDLPVLRFVNENPPRDEMLGTNWLSDKPDERLPALTEQAFHYSVKTLHDAGYVAYRDDSWEGGGGVLWLSFQVTGAGKQVLGEWPYFDALGEPAELAAVLDALATMATTEDEEGHLREGADRVRKLSAEGLRQVAVGVLGGLARSQVLGG